MTNDFDTIQRRNEARFGRFLGFLEKMLCKRCWRERRKAGKPYHHHGGLLYLIGQAAELNRPAFDRWVKETEHGYAHGFVTAYLAFATRTEAEIAELYRQMEADASDFSRRKGTACLKRYDQKELKPERMVLACLVHDFLKVVGDDDRHDDALVHLFPSLGPEVYRHANPLPEDELHPLVVADRLELMRYPDHREWCDMGVLAKYVQMYGEADLRHFYAHIRPVIEKVFRDRGDVWISHVIESPCSPRADVFPENHWYAQDPGCVTDSDTWRYVAVNSGPLPVVGCHVHTWVAWGAKHNYLMGMASRTALRKLGHKIIHPPDSVWGRDHVFVRKEQDIPLTEWSFVYDKPEDYRVIDYHNAHLMSRNLFDALVNVSEEVLWKFRTLCVE